MCFSAAKWKREEVQDHKFDFVDVADFYEDSILRKLKYSVLFMIVLKSILVYIADMWTAGILLIFDRWGSSVQPKIPFFISKWIYVGCIFMSFLLLAWDIKKARHIIATRDISYAFTSTIAYRFYTLRSYKISELLKKKVQKRVQKRQQEATAEAKGDFSHLKNKKGGEKEMLRQPKLPIFQDDAPLLPPYGQIPYANPPDAMMLPPYGSRSGTPGPTRPGTPVSRSGTLGTRAGTPVPRTGTPGPRPGVPGNGPPGSQRGPFMSRRNSNSSIRSDMTGYSAYSGTTTYTLSGPGYPVPSRSHTPIPSRSHTPVPRAYTPAQMPRQQNPGIDAESLYGGAFDGYDFDHEDSSHTADEFNAVVDNFRSDNMSQTIIDTRRMPPPAAYPPHMRSNSPTPSVSSTTSSRVRPQQTRTVNADVSVSSRYYQSDQRGPRQNNYAQQGGGQAKPDSIY
ncbi:2200_t:CDS:2 [Acaulospora colombiana]|uniref:2200_t:CDS:1 n=1 Tax=Acaulospora colombiana TaxID=27376 RepID=A0ACA9MQF4_9GLOM|nr:2200_t:CDS:2 [Acaulospora colombiana]